MLYHKNKILSIFAFLCIICAFGVFNLRLNFEFEQFFPEGDPDLLFFNEFTSDFEKDDNFLFISLNNDGKEIFDTVFLKRLHEFTLETRSINLIQKSQSITTIKYPIKTPFGFNLMPLIHMQDAVSLKTDKYNLQQDERFNRSFLSKDGLATNVLLKTKKNISVSQSDSLMSDINILLNKYNFEGSKNHMLGRAVFQTALVDMQKKEVLLSTFISSILVALIMYLIFGSIYTVIITVIAIGASLLIFMGILSFIGRELSVMAALYPIIILIVGVADVIHLMTKYIDTIDDDKEKNIPIMKEVIKEIGFATFLTCITTSIGFFTLYTSKLYIIREFGINAGFGVLVAFAVIVIVVPCMLVMFKKSQLYNPRGQASALQKLAMHGYKSSKLYPKSILAFFVFLTLFSFYGMSLITTNYKIIENLPRNSKVTSDFLFFEKNFSGYRPLEFAITVKQPNKANDFQVVQQINKIEQYLKTIPNINSIYSQATIYKSMEMMHHANQKAYYKMPDSLYTFLSYQSMLEKTKNFESNVLINKTNSKTRISSIIGDIGADSIKAIGINIDQWIYTNTDTNMISVRRTGTGIILDKNSDYITGSLMSGLLLSVIVISLLMAYLVKSFKMLIIALVPNLIPLVFGAAILGFFHIELEGGVSIIFSIIYGIAVDDTIHFLSRYKLCIEQGMEVEKAIEMTFVDTGKSVVLTSIILFFGFLVMLFSNYPPSVVTGVLTAFTLLSALLSDLYLMPIMIRYFYRKV